ncbi:hypothetical protein JCM15519_38440 [Fundidesulfovibrio butyratiphilus]
MIASEIQTVRLALGTAMERVDQETRAVLLLCRERLDATADLAGELEAQVVATRALEAANRKAKRRWQTLTSKDGAQ